VDLDDPGFKSRLRHKFLFSLSSRPPLRTPSLQFNGYRDSILAGKVTKTRNAWSCTTTPTVCPRRVHRDSSIFPFYSSPYETDVACMVLCLHPARTSSVVRYMQMLVLFTALCNCIIKLHACLITVHELHLMTRNLITRGILWHLHCSVGVLHIYQLLELAVIRDRVPGAERRLANYRKGLHTRARTHTHTDLITYSSL
jgi:hypothetical protein